MTAEAGFRAGNPAELTELGRTNPTVLVNYRLRNFILLLEIGAGSVLLLSLVFAIGKWWRHPSPPVDFDVSHVKTTVDGARKISLYHLTVSNHSAEDVRLIGGNACGPSGCIDAKPLPSVVPPGMSERLEVEVNANAQTSAEMILTLYVQDRETLKMIPIKFKSQPEE
jgi:hypothetical protein